MMKIFYKIIFSVLLFFAIFPFSFAYDFNSNNNTETYHAKVLKILKEEMRDNVFADKKSIYQFIKAKALDGPQKNNILEVENDYQKLKNGDKFFYKETNGEGGDKTY